jgi:L-aminopeptidase/D-esterase-like protein
MLRDLDASIRAVANLAKAYAALEGLKIGHASDFDGITGCTVILAEKGASGGVDVRGGASGSVEHGVLDPMHITAKVHAIVLSGGSAFGLEASSGVRRTLEAQGIGFEMRGMRIPIVPGAILYDLGIGKATARPTREMGEAAAAAALAMRPGASVEEGCVGAGTGATFGKANGMNCAMKGGFGYASVQLGGRFTGVEVAAMVALNAFGDVLDEDGKILAGARKGPKSKSFENTVRKMMAGRPLGTPQTENTTIGVVATNAKLSKVEATKLAQMSQAGLLRRIAPAHTTMDGDTLFALSTGDTLQADINVLGVAGAEALSLAIERAARLAKSMGGVVALRDL